MSASAGRVRCVECGSEGVPARATKISGGPGAVAPVGWIVGLPLAQFDGDLQAAERHMKIICSSNCWNAFSERDEARGLEPIAIHQHLWCDEDDFATWVASVERHSLARSSRSIAARDDAALQEWFAAGIPADAAAAALEIVGAQAVSPECRRRALELLDELTHLLGQRRRHSVDQDAEMLAQSAVLNLLSSVHRSALDVRGLAAEWCTQLTRVLWVTVLAEDSQRKLQLN